MLSAGSTPWYSGRPGLRLWWLRRVLCRAAKYPLSRSRRAGRCPDNTGPVRFHYSGICDTHVVVHGAVFGIPVVVAVESAAVTHF